MRALIPALCLLAGCRSGGGERAPDLAACVASAHGAGFYAAPAVTGALRVEFGGSVALEGTLWYEPTTGRARLQLADGAVAVFDGQRAWVAPADADVPRARFHLLTWPYFLAAPWKLGDPGTRLVREGQRPLDGAPHHTARLTFEGGVGDTPDDWYLVYVDPETCRLDALAYIVTYGTPVAEAEQEPHAALYGDWTEVAGLRFPGELVIHDWSLERGPFGDPLGRATFRDLRVTAAPPGAFDRPAGAREDELPGE